MRDVVKDLIVFSNGLPRLVTPKTVGLGRSLADPGWLALLDNEKVGEVAQA